MHLPACRCLHLRSLGQSLQELGFSEDANNLVAAWNTLDAQLYDWAGQLLRLDAAFHSAAALVSGHVHPTKVETTRGSAAHTRQSTANVEKPDALSDLSQALAVAGLRKEGTHARYVRRVVSANAGRPRHAV